MIKRSTVIKNKTGLHARPAALFVRTASQFKSNITICRAEEKESCVNAKNIISLLTLGLCQGDNVEVSTDGDDEQEAVDNLIALIDSGFGE